MNESVNYLFERANSGILSAKAVDAVITTTASTPPKINFTAETNPFLQRARKELNERLAEILEPEKVRRMLDDAGLKVTSSTMESRLEKLLQIYKLSQFKGQQLEIQLGDHKKLIE